MADKEELQKQLQEMEQARIKEAELAIQQICNDYDVQIVPIVQIIPGTLPTATLLIKSSK